MSYSLKTELEIGAVLGESPIWSKKENALYFVDILAPSIHRFEPETGKHSVLPVHEHIGCIGLRENGGFIAAMRNGVYLLNSSGEMEKKIADNPTDPIHSRFNDGKVDPWGRFWCGTIWEPRDFLNGKLCRVDSNLNMEVKAGDILVSNGLAFSPDRKWMFHSDTPNHVLYRYPLDTTTGEIAGSREVFMKFEKPQPNQLYGGRPDGGTFDREGYYWSAQFGGGRVLRISPDGKISDEIKLPVNWPTMVCFGGEDLKTLYITSSRENRTEEELREFPQSGNLFSVRLHVAGCEEPFLKEK